jgi:hypothetical protein
VELEELLLGQGGSEVGVVLADDRHGALADFVRQPVVARAAALETTPRPALPEAQYAKEEELRRAGLDHEAAVDVLEGQDDYILKTLRGLRTHRSSMSFRTRWSKVVNEDLSGFARGCNRQRVR